MNIVGIIMAVGDVLIRAAAAFNKPAAPPPVPHDPERIPVPGEVWELIRPAQRPFAKRQVAVKIRGVALGWVVYVFVDNDSGRIEGFKEISMTVDSFVELYRPTSG
jgi:hypothetical protein